jgi:PKHD-type hydroxylase
MILCLGDILKADERADLRKAIAGAGFEPGVNTAGWHARLVKANDQLTGADPVRLAADRLVRAALQRSDLFQMAAQPRHIGPIMVNRYTGGGTYGDHVDNPIMNDGDRRYRSDLSFTVFLSDPDEYEGGGLVISSDTGVDSLRLPAGAMVLYPSATLHRVEPVTRGERLACVGWCQSYVRGAAEREILFDLDMAARAVFDKDGKTKIFDRLAKSHANLLRMWAEL